MIEDELDRLLADERDRAPALSAGFMATQQARARALQPRLRPNPRRWRWRAWFAATAGLRPAMAGLAAVAVLGTAAGYASPDVMSAGFLALPGDELELVPVLEPFLVES